MVFEMIFGYDKLSSEDKEFLQKELAQIDLDELQKLYNEAKNPKKAEEASEVTPMPYTDATRMSVEEKERLSNIGMEVLKAGKMCALTLAGGQGSRLGHEGPKGTYDIGLPSHKSIFEILADGVKEASEKAGCIVPWYIMTSELNHRDTTEFFEAHNYFGYDKNAICFFKQDNIAILNKDGEIMLENSRKILRGPNGNGGLFSSAENAGALSDMRERGIEWIFVHNVDNVLCKILDPLFIGFTIDTRKKVTAKSFVKRGPDEKAGVFCYKDKKPCVIEYTEISPELANAKDENGNWLYGDTNVNNCIFNIDTFEFLAKANLPYHPAIKKMTYFDGEKMVKSETPDSYKFEMFLFDGYMLLDDIGVLRIDREEEFAPVKNKTGEDSAELAREMYLKVRESI